LLRSFDGKLRLPLAERGGEGLHLHADGEHVAVGREPVGFLLVLLLVVLCIAVVEHLALDALG